MNATQFLTPALRDDEEEVERSLRPHRLDEFVGQARVKEQLAIALEAAWTEASLDLLLVVAEARGEELSRAHAAFFNASRTRSSGGSSGSVSARARSASAGV